LLIRAVDDITGGNLSGMHNERYNYGPGSKNPSHGPHDTKAFNELFEKVEKKCKGKKL